MAQRKVTTIPARISREEVEPLASGRKRRVAGYARVSTDRDEQATSYEAQVDYYTNYIRQNPEWEFVGIYTDEGISATNTRRREGFKRMVTDALGGKIDLIVTKSVSRFARNTVDSLTTIRELKDKGVEVYFQKENIWTMDAKGELLITIMSSLAQEESRSISENTTWGQRKSFADGKVRVPYSRFLGYDRGPNGGLVVNQEQAKTVKLIFSLFLKGMSFNGIAKELTARGIPSPGGSKVWWFATVKNILTNEKYKGDALLQKVFTVDFLQKKKKKNEGEVPQYYVEGDHEAIIDPVTFDFVQLEIEKRYKENNHFSGLTLFSSKIVCGECGGWYGSKVWHSNDKYRRVVYQCNNKYQGEHKCTTPHITEDEVKRLFVKAVNIRITDKEELIENLRAAIDLLADTDALDAQQKTLRDEMEIVSGLVDQCIRENAQSVLDQDEYTTRYNGLVHRYNEAKKIYDQVLEDIAGRKARRTQLEMFLKGIADAEPIEEFDEQLWSDLIDHMTVYSKENIRFIFRDETEVQV